MKKFGPEQNLAKCSNPKCPSSERESRHYIPVRFVRVCENGHIDDFPFAEWVHNGSQLHENDLEYVTGNSVSLNNIQIRCKKCSAKKSLAGALSNDGLGDLAKCSGTRPWLGTESGPEDCDSLMQGAQKGGLNIYFTLPISSLFIPDLESAVPESLRVWVRQSMQSLEVLVAGIDSDDVEQMVHQFINANIEQHKCKDPAIVLDYVKELIADEGEPSDSYVSELEYRYQEHKVLQKYPGPVEKDYEATQVNAKEYGGQIGDYFSKITLVEKLRITRAFAGFTRLKPYNGKSLRDLIQQLNDGINELPADVIRGEGIFIDFNSKQLDEWEKRISVIGRAEQIISNFQTRFGGSVLAESISPRFILLHTFAHLLINELAEFAGYGNSSLQERIYSSKDEDTKMGGILIYTASGDSEGSLGGLVDLGRQHNFPQIVDAVIERSSWCSSDPICQEIGPQGPYGANLAACHNCSILPETSCELFNQLLDRGMLTGLLTDETIAYFNKKG
ncbi:MAG: DUF1998 domain-containing protein [Bacteroidetes bacterium]|nr:DUF1998 domain-containing protein [Bacteroidota bacterium]